ncbi:hypothetical protein PSPO01_12463 [Paraphaeosphaeria sporulosa]
MQPPRTADRKVQPSPTMHNYAITVTQALSSTIRPNNHPSNARIQVTGPAETSLPAASRAHPVAAVDTKHGG